MKTRFWLGLIAAVTMTMHNTPRAVGATVSLSMEYLGSFDSDFNPLGLPLVTDPGSSQPDWYHQLDVFVNINGALPNESLHGIQFDIDMSPSLMPADFGGWIPDAPLWDPPGLPPPIGIFSTNADQGSDTNDLQRIRVIVSSAAAAHTINPGESAPYKIGSAFVQWNGGYPGTVEIVPDGPWSLYVDNDVVSQPISTFVQPIVPLFEIPILESLLLEVTGNDTVIANGDATPSIVDNTDFGEVAPDSVQERTFVINAIPFGPLEIEAPVITGPFSIVGAFPTSVENSAAFTVAFDTSAGLGLHTGSISFANNSENAPSFSFALSAFVVPEPTSFAFFAFAATVICGVSSRGRS